jgi:cysteine-rich repeat protein
MHMHLVFFQILDRDTFTVGAGGEIVPDGNPQPPLPGESGWKDTAMVDPGEILRVIVRFEDYKGKYAYHCHILEHEDHEMMRQFETVSCGDNELDTTESCDDGNTRIADGCSAGCDLEEYVEFAGVASGTGGGRVDLSLAGVLIRVNTVAGQTAAQIAQALADAINADGTLQGLGVGAVAVGNRIVTTGDITALDIRDNGLGEVLELSAQKDRLWWGNVENVSGYDVVQGSVDQLRALSGDFSSPLVTTDCLVNDAIDTTVSIVGGDPPSGSAYWYVLRRQPGGSWDGTDAIRDVAVNASGNACP